MAFFAQKTLFLGQFLMDFFLTGRGGNPPPLNGNGKPSGKKLTEMGGTPLNGKFPCLGLLNFPLTFEASRQADIRVAAAEKVDSFITFITWADGPSEKFAE